MDYKQTISAIRKNMKKAIVGKDEIIDLLLVSLICSGHVLVEDVPGLGKTTMVSALASSLGCSFQRIQFTPDVLPSDITGFNMYNLQNGEKEFHKGSAMNQIVLADEINRASPKTQSALLEAMQERQVTVDGVTYQLPKPFMVLATQNPVDMAGTYPLPEAQLDRFFMQISVGYPSFESEKDILRTRRSTSETIELDAVATTEDVIALQHAVDKIHCADSIYDYIVNIVKATRTAEGVLLGASPRGSIALLQAACGYAMLCGREYVIPDDVKAMAPYVLRHRVIMRGKSGSTNSSDAAIKKILNNIKAPKAEKE